MPTEPPDTESRAERKERTRRAILDAALALAADSNLAAISLRQVAKQVGVVPTAFYASGLPDRRACARRSTTRSR